MNAPPDQSVTAKLEGCVIDAVVIMRYQIDFICEGHKFSFSVSSPLCFGRNDEVEDMPWTEFPMGRTDIPRILGSTIVSAQTDEQKSLRIQFSTGDTLLASWSPMYESYEIQVDGVRIIV